MNKLLRNLKEEENYTLTENGAITRKTTFSNCLDFFAFGGAMRNRSEEDVILQFKKAYKENPLISMKLLFYFRDVRGGQGERRLFRVITKWLEKNNSKALKKNLIYFAEFGRWDDLLELGYKGSKFEKEVLSIVKNQLETDLKDMSDNKPISLLAKRMPSLGASSVDTKLKAKYFAKKLGMNAKKYRKTLVKLRNHIRLVETQMSSNNWHEIEFDKLPSKAGLKYRKAFERHCEERYRAFMYSDKTTVNAATLYPYEVVEKAIGLRRSFSTSTTERNVVNKYWSNLKDYFNGKSCSLLPVVDTSGSMWGTPINVAISLGIYCAERNKGPFKDHYISFSRKARLVEVEGIDFVDKVRRIYDTNLCENTNIESVFDLVLNTALKNNLSQEDLPQNIAIISDMEFDNGVDEFNRWSWRSSRSEQKYSSHETLMESIAKKWQSHGYEMPHLIYWNVNARQNNIPMLGSGRISYVSGFSPSTFEIILTGKTGYELMMETVEQERYSCITV